MVVPVKTTLRKFFRQYIELLKTIPPLDSLRNRELDVLGEIMYQDYKYRSVEDDEARKALVFSKAIRKEMRENIGMSEDTYNNNISIIRKNGVLSSNNNLPDFLRIDPKEDAIINFRFYVEE